ncbi:MAG: T9SS type A sorting domain-containing protein [Saprospiraceae bacterium]
MASSMAALIFGLANSGLHPVSGTSGYTGAPGDATCGQCHTGGNATLDGNVSISGLPNTITAGMKYTIVVSVTNPNGNAARAGFQMLALTGTNTNAGTFENNSPNTEIRQVSGGKKYFGHMGAPAFPTSKELVFTVEWTAPTTVGLNPIIKLYASAVIANGADGNSKDRVVITSREYAIQANTDPLQVFLTNVVGSSCSDSKDGFASAVTTGGTPPYTYLWSNGATTATNSTLPQGMATVTVTDSNNGQLISSTTITAPPAIQMAAFGTKVCDINTKGILSVLASGGAGGYSYHWSMGATSAQVNDVLPGQYTVTVTDANNCKKTATAAIEVNADISISALVLNDNSCVGVGSGSINISVSGGSSPYDIHWSNGATSANFTNLSVGNYTVTVTDGVGCTHTSAFTIDQAVSLSAATSLIKNVSCVGFSDGQATVVVSGGSPPYAFDWNNGATGTGLANTQTNLSSGNYTVTVSDFFDCKFMVNFVIKPADSIHIEAVKVQHVRCFQHSDGLISIAPTSNGTHAYQWSNGSTTSQISGIGPGAYTVTVTNNIGCTNTKSFTISEPLALKVAIDSLSSNKCHGDKSGYVQLSATGGVSSYRYMWSNGETNEQIQGLNAGKYTVSVTDFNGCTNVLSIDITEPDSIAIQIQEIKKPSCAEKADGQLIVSGSQGKPPYTYLWSNGETTIHNLHILPGKYTVTVTDQDLCTNKASFLLESVPPFEIKLGEVHNIICYGDSTGSASVIAHPFTKFEWFDGSIGDTIGNLGAGNYFVYGIDTLNCKSLPLPFSISQAPKIQPKIIQADTLLCPPDSSGYLLLSLHGGTGHLSYMWSNGINSLEQSKLTVGFYTITITDEKKCIEQYTYQIQPEETIEIISSKITNSSCFGASDGSIILDAKGGFGHLGYTWSNDLIAKDTLNGLKAGKYAVSVTGLSGCMISDSFIVHQPDSIIVQTSVTDETLAGLNDGKIIVSIKGGTAPYEILWHTGATSFEWNQVAPGLYTYIITDKNKCNYRGEVVVGGGACNLSATYRVQHPTCHNSFDGKIDLHINGAYKEYDVQIYDENELVKYTLSTLPEGVFTIQITDSIQCIAFLFDVKLKSLTPPILLDNLTIVQPTTSSSMDGSLDVTAKGGKGNITYKWYKNDVPYAIGNKISSLTVGIYRVDMTDSLGCELKSENIILQAPSGTLDQLSHHFTLYPNPVIDQITILNPNAYELSNFEVYTINGVIVELMPQNIRPEAALTVIDLKSSLENGIYFLKFLANKQPVFKKIIILNRQ